MSVLLSVTLAATSVSAPVMDRVVSVASRSEQPAGEVAGSVSLIEREAMDRLVVSNVADLVRYEPGVSAPEEASRFGVQGFDIRGLSGNRVGIEIDGVPLADGFAVGSFSNAGRAAIETDFLARAELLRGPASTLYGSDALAGVVSLRTVTPADWLSGADGVAGQVAATTSSIDQAASLSGLVAWQQGQWNAVMGQVWRRGDQRENRPREGGLDSNPADYAALSSLFKLGLSADGAEFRLSLDRYRQARQTDVQSLRHGPGQYATTSALLADDYSSRQSASLAVEGDCSVPGFDQWRALLYGQKSRTDQDTVQYRDALPPRTPASLRERNFLFKTEVAGLRLQAEGRFDWGGVKHWQVAGLDLAETEQSELRNGRETNLQTGVSSNVIIGERFPLRDFPDSRSLEWGLFWQDEISGSDRLTLIPGLRYERYSIRPEVDAIFREDNPGLTPARIDTDRLTPKLGARWQLSPGVQVFAQYALGFRAPPMADVNIGFTIPAFNYRAIPNPDLKPEYSRGLELGVRLADSWGNAEIALYHNQYRDLIDSRVNLGRDAGGALVFQSINRARARIQGIEARAELGLPIDTLSLHLALAYARGDDTEHDVPLNSVEPASASLGLVWQPQSRQRFELRASGVAGKRRIDHSTRQLFAPPGYLLLDAYWHRQLSENWAFDFAARNLGNRRYWLWSGVRGLALDDREVDLYSQPGRSVSLALRYRF